MYSSEEEKVLFYVMNKLRKLAIRNTNLPVSHVEFMVLHTIFEAPDHKIKISDIAKNMDVSTPAISKMLGHLEEKGFVIRVSNDIDRRVTYANITGKGKDVLYSSFKMLRQLITRVTEKMGTEKIEQLVNLFKELHLVLIEELEQTPINNNPKPDKTDNI